MNYDNIKLEKGMYSICNKSFTKVLEELDPSGNYKGTDLEGLDAYQRQLKRFGIKVSGPHCDTVEKFFMNSQSAVLFPEFISRAVKKGIYTQNNLPIITAAKSIIDTIDYRTVKSNLETATYSGNEVPEGNLLPEVTIRTNSNLITLKKHGRVLSSSYEALRFQNLDVLAVILRKVGLDIINEHLADAINVLKDGSTSQTVATVSYDALLTLWSSLKPHNMNVMITTYDIARRIMALDEMRDANAGLDFQGTGRDISPMGARLICSNIPDAKTVIGLDKDCALQMIQSGDVVVDYDKVIDRQLDKTTLSVTAGFSKIFTGATKIISITN